MKRSLPLILTMLLLCTACGAETEQKPEDTKDTQSTEETEPVTEEGEASPNIPAADYNKYNFRILTTDIAENETAYHEVFTEGENAEPVNDAVWKRNKCVEEKYNITITGLFDGLFDYRKLQTTVQADEDAYDAAFLNLLWATSYAGSGYLVEIHEIPYLNFEQPWWLTDSVTETSIMNRNYYAIGDANLTSYESTPVIFFNKKTAQENDLNDLYQLVDSGKWTYDKMLELCALVGSDENGDGVRDENDSYGLSVNGFSVLTMTYGGGFHIIEKDADDIPHIGISEAFVTFMQKHIETVATNPNILSGEAIANGNVNKGAEIRKTVFRDGRVLFYNEMLTMATMLRNMETDFGVLPLPKSDESQEKYYSFFHTTNSSAVTVPVTNKDLDRTGRILEDLVYQSHLLVRPAYLETTVKAKMMRDEESERMLSMILDNIIFDSAIDPGVLDAIRPLFNSGSLSIMSELEKKMPKLESTLERTIKAYGKTED